MAEEHVLREPADGSVSPYSDLPADRFWRTGVATRSPLDPGNLYQAKFQIDRTTSIMTVGSCFAQHVGRFLRQSGFRVIDEEPLPDSFPDELANRLGFRQYSARYGNIYTVRQLLQLHDEAFGLIRPAVPVWEKNGQYYDAQRPNIDGIGATDPEMVLRHRASHLAAVRRAFQKADLLVFTLGLTEVWIHRETGTVYPTAPGTVAGSHDPNRFNFHNFDAFDVVKDFHSVRDRLKKRNSKIRFLLTVSPVPLTATASGQHVEVATTYSKATLRAACGMLQAQFDDVDYFPSFEIITSQATRAAYYRPNLREVSEEGVRAAMTTFLMAHGVTIGAQAHPAESKARRAADIACEDALLEGFAQ